MTDHCRNGFLQERQCFRFFVFRFNRVSVFPK